MITPSSPLHDLDAWAKRVRSMSSSPDLFELRVSTIYPDDGRGADIAFRCEADRGGTYYCKQDKPPRLIRATEWLCTHLASHLGISTPSCAVLRDREGVETFFGSLQVPSPAGHFEVKAYLTKEWRDETERLSGWLGGFLAGLYAFDMFVGNPDRGLNNFLLRNEGISRTLQAFDFASADVLNFQSANFPIASDATRKIGMLLRARQGFPERYAIEMIDRIAAVPATTIDGILRAMPADWMDKEQREIVCELWSTQRLGTRLHALRSGLKDGTLL